MSAAPRLLAFAVLVAVVAGGAALAGAAFGPDPVPAAPRAHAAPEAHTAPQAPSHGAEPERTHATGGGHPAPAVRGLAVAQDGLTLALARTALPRGRRAELRFRITGPSGDALRDFEVEHERRMHVIVVRRDGTGFQHLHPRMAADGTWAVPVTLADAGAYRVFADFKHDGEARTLAADLTVDGAASYAELPEPRTVARTAQGHEVRLDAGPVRAGRDAELRFTVTRGGRTVHTEPYLGAGGHLVALREGDLAYLHVHPGGHGDGHGRPEAGHDDAVAFTTAFPNPGRFRLFLQFRDDGRVHTAAFTLEVTR
jgi:hypothetical protein